MLSSTRRNFRGIIRGGKNIMSINVDLEKVNYEKFINNLMENFKKINSR